MTKDPFITTIHLTVSETSSGYPAQLRIICVEKTNISADIKSAAGEKR